MDSHPRGPTYPLAYRGPSRPGPKPHLDDPAFRSNILVAAAQGLSRRGVAAIAGVPKATLETWLSRGRAEPNNEPYGSFASQYLRAERALEAAAAGTVAHVVNELYRRAKAGLLTSDDDPQLKELLRVLQARYPEDWGTHAHRKPEAELTGAEWLEQHPLTHAQIVEMLLDPPEEV